MPGRASTPPSLSALVRARRAALGLSQQALADGARMSRSAINEIENGRIGAPGAAALTRLAAALELPIADLLRVVTGDAKAYPQVTRPTVVGEREDFTPQELRELTRYGEYLKSLRKK